VSSESAFGDNNFGLLSSVEEVKISNVGTTAFLLTLLIALIQTMSLFVNFDVPGSVIFQVLHFPVFVLFWSAIFRSCKFSAPAVT